MKEMLSLKSNNCIRRTIAYVAMFVIGTLLLLFVSRETGYYIQNDSHTYMELGNKHGVMPLYPLFLYGMRVVFGVEAYLTWVVYVQTIFAVAASLFAVSYFEKKYKLGLLESVVCYIALLLLFNIDYIFSGTTHQILTEGLVYPLFYVYIVFLFRSIDNKWAINTVINVLLVCILSMLRSQMKMMIVISAFVAFYYWSRCWYITKKAKNIIVAFVSAIVIAAAAFALCAGIDSVLQHVTMNIVQNQNGAISEDKTDSDITAANVTPVEHGVNQAFDLFDGKILYTAEETDVDLFEDKDVRLVYSIIYKAMDEEKCLYKYAEPGLNKWRSMLAFNNCSRVCSEAYTEYIDCHSELSGDFISYYDAMSEITSVLLQHHWSDMISHIGVFYLHGVMCGVCFENEEHLVLCYLVTIVSYLFAIGMIVMRLIQKETDKRDVELLILTIILMMMLNAMVAIPLFTIRRYVCYFIGIYYALLFICLRNWAVNTGLIKRK